LDSEAISTPAAEVSAPVARTIRWVVPAYNEEASIEDLIDRIAEVSEAQQWRWTLLVVDDGSRDATGELARATAATLPVTVVRNEPNAGLGRTIRRGLREASAAAGPDDVIVTLDADLTQDPAYAPSMLAKLDEGFDVVIASRYRKGSAVEGLSTTRRMLSYGASGIVALVRPVPGVRDYSCGFRAYRARVIREGFERHGDEFVSEPGFACMLEISERLRGHASFAEVPFVLHYGAKRKESAIKILPTIGAYFRVIARIAFSTPGESPLRWVAAGIAALLCFVLFPTVSRSHAVAAQGMIWRGALAGAACGLSLGGSRRYVPSIVLALAASVLGLCALRFGSVVPVALHGAAYALALAALAAAGAVMLRAPRVPAWVALAVASALLVASLGWCAGVYGANHHAFAERTSTLSVAPVPGKYDFDGDIFIRTYQLMRTGQGYYRAFATAWTQDRRQFGQQMTSRFNVREPALFYLWTAIPGPPEAATLLVAFLVFSAASVVVCYVFSATFVDPGVALLGGVAMVSYYAWFALTKTWFTFAEVWAGAIVVLALLLLARRRWLASAVVLVLAVAVRELAVLFVPVWLVAWAVPDAGGERVSGERRRAAWALGVAALGSALVLAVHLSLAPVAHGGVAAGVSTWLRVAGLSGVTSAYTYGLARMPFGGWFGPWAIVLATAGSLLLPSRRLRWSLLAAVLVPLAFLFAFTNGVYGYYWGGIAQPTVFAMAPLVFARLAPRHTDVA